MARISQETKQQVRAALIEVAAEHFARDGFDRANINAIALEAGFAKGTIYNYFSSKEILFAAVLAEACRRVAKRYAALNIEGTTEAHLLAVAQADVEVLREAEAFIRVLVREAMSFRPNTYPLLIENLAPILNLLSVILQIGQERGEIRSDKPAFQLGLIFIGQLSLLYIQHWGSDGNWPTLAEIPALAVDLFFHGAAGSESSFKGSLMSSYVFMKVLESTPARYDRGMKILSRGRIDEIYQEIAARIAHPNAAILDVGCGTGGVALACAARGAQVEGIDIHAGMLELAAQKSQLMDLSQQITWHQLGAVEIEDVFREAQFDAVVFCLSMSEMSPDERSYALEISHSRLKPGGWLIIADEVLPKSTTGRLAHWLKRLPFVLTTYLLTQTTTQALPEIEDLVAAKNFVDLDTSRPWSDTFAILAARRQ